MRRGGKKTARGARTSVPTPEVTKARFHSRAEAGLTGAILDTIHALVVVLDPDGRIVLFNQACEKLTGYPEGEVLGRFLWDVLMVPEEKAAAMQVFEGLASGHFPNCCQNACLATDGNRRLIEWTNTALLDRDGAVKFVIGTGIDITDRKQTEEALRAARDEFYQIFNAVSDGLRLIDRDYNIVRVNNAFARMADVTVSEAVGAKCYDVFGGPICRTSRCPLQMVLKDELPREFEVEKIRGDGTHILCIATAAAFRDPSGRLLGIVETYKDISARKQAEVALKALAARLEKSNKDLEEFASIASHDLQEPLNLIQAFSLRFRTKFGQEIPPQGLTYLERIENAARRMQTLIEGLLMCSRVTTRGLPFVPVDLSSAVAEAVSNLQVRMEETGGTVNVGKLPVIQGDPLQLRQLFQNLIGNALKYHRPGQTPVVRISGRMVPAEETEGESCRISVEDNGIGFDPRHMDRIFGIFQRLHGRNEYEGSGIGLAICKRIVERHGGHITAESRPGMGSTFIVTFPLRQKEPPG